MIPRSDFKPDLSIVTISPHLRLCPRPKGKILGEMKRTTLELNSMVLFFIGIPQIILGFK
jgi:hypothetical protein